MLVAVTAFYAALLAIVHLALAAHAGMTRDKARIPLGDGGNPQVIAAMRRQMNFVENVPLAIILLALAELGGAPHWWMHALGLALLLARIVHPFGLRYDRMATPARVVGATVTSLVILAGAITLLTQTWTAWR